MKAIIFLAGVGNRLREVTDDPKCLLEIDGKPLIIRNLDAIDSSGINEVILVVGYKKERIKEIVGDSYKNIKVKYIENKDYLKGSILSLLYAKDEFNDDVITMDGDVLYPMEILQILIDNVNRNCFLLDFDFQEQGDEFKVVINKQGLVTALNYEVEKKQDEMVGEEVGFIKWSKQDAPIFKQVFQKLLDDGKDDDVAEYAIRYIVENNLCQFGAASIQGLPWIEIDFPEDLERAKKLLFDKPKIETKYRKVISEIPGPKSIELYEKLKKSEPLSSINQLPIGIKKSYGINVEDVDGNIFLDGTSGVVVANIGHSPKVIIDSIKEQLDKFHHIYSFPYEKRVELTKKLIEIAPDNINQVLLMTIGSEVSEAAIQVARMYNHKKYGREKNIIIGFKGCYHGRTMGAVMAGGIQSMKEHINHQDPDMLQVEFPDCYRCWKGREKYENCTQDCLNKLKEKLEENRGKVAAVMCETFRGRDLVFAPKDFLKGVEQLCKEHNALFILDEIQAGFGRLGNTFGFQNYDVKPNLICCGKGISSGMPLSVLLGESEVLAAFHKGSMTSSHGADPICVVATIANINKLLENDKEILKNVSYIEQIFKTELNKLKEKYDCIGDVRGEGMIWGIDIVKDRNTKEPDVELADKIHLNAVKKGVFLKVPRGQNKNVININPPLIIQEDAVREILSVLEDSIKEVSRGQ